MCIPEFLGGACNFNLIGNHMRSLLLFLLLSATALAQSTVIHPISNGRLENTFNANGQQISQVGQITLGSGINTVTLGRSGTTFTITGDLSLSGTINLLQGLPVTQLTGTVADPAWLTAVAWSKITGKPDSEPPLGSPDTDGKVLASTASGTRSWVSLPVVNPSWILRSGVYTAVAGDKILADTSLGAFTITLPASPTQGDSIKVADAKGTFANSSKHLTVDRAGKPIAGAAGNLVLDINNAAIELVFVDNTFGWQVLRFQ